MSFVILWGLEGLNWLLNYRRLSPARRGTPYLDQQGKCCQKGCGFQGFESFKIIQSQLHRAYNFSLSSVLSRI